ncbi:MAG: hypothetical protein LBL09_03540 [Oscillospiraceae bacterium]|jgi:putative aldouronate transport system substrate-binding protein|nr:hypothetical protein [Oscillospiraceae bacterium]
MKHYTRVLAILLTLLLSLTLFAGCDNNPAAGTTQPPAQSKDPASSPSEETPGDEYVYKMPIVDDSYKITAWRSFTSTYLSNPNEILSWKELERVTNVAFDFTLSSNADAQTSFNLLVVSNNLPDVMIPGLSAKYVGGTDKAIEEGVYLDLTDTINKWCPNLLATLAEQEIIAKLYKTDKGRMGAFSGIHMGGEQLPWVGPGIRVDMLDQVGISGVPATYDELHTALTKFKNDLNVEQPLIMNYMGYNATSHSLTSGFNVAPGFYNENGTAKYGFIEQGFKDYITMMNQWYSEGLIDQEFYTRTGPTDAFAFDRIPVGKVGATDMLMFTMIEQYKGMTDDPNFYIKALAYPRQSIGQDLHFRWKATRVLGNGAQFVISGSTTDEFKLEVIARWVDFLFTPEGWHISNYGEEGVSFEVVNGVPQYTDYVLDNPDGIPSSDMMAIVSDANMFPGLFDWERERQLVSEEAWNSYYIWGDASSGDWNMPLITMTDEEGAEYATIMGDIDTLVTEMIPQFISGMKAMSEYDAFIQRIKALDIDRAIEIQQAALTRFLAR